MSNYRRRSAASVRRRRNRRDMILISVAVTILFIVLFVAGLNLKKKLNDTYLVQNEIQTQLEEEQERSEKIEGYREYINSDEAIKKEARDKLGLIEKNQIIFKAE